MDEDNEQITEIEPHMAGLRIDQVLALLYPDFSRSRLQKWLKDGQILVDGVRWQAKNKVSGGEQVVLRARLDEEVVSPPQDISLDLVFQDESILVLNKPAGLVVHPAVGNRDGTLLNGLLYHFPGQVNIPRAGIVHRLDKDTSGLMVVARTLEAQTSLVAQLQEKSVFREYRAVVNGVMVAGGTVDQPIGRHPRDRKRMAVVERGKAAVTHYRVLEKFRAHTCVKLNLETGRTHQIRVHMAHIGYPIVGDPVYGGRLRILGDADPLLEQRLRGMGRQALHACGLGLVHPSSGEQMEWRCELPGDMEELLEALRVDAKRGSGS